MYTYTSPSRISSVAIAILTLVTIYAVPGVSSRPSTEEDQLHLSRANCTTCRKELHENVFEVITHLKKIQVRILNTVGKHINPTEQQSRTGGGGTKPRQTLHVPSLDQPESTTNSDDVSEIVAKSETPGVTQHNWFQLTFRLSDQTMDTDGEALGASIVLLLHRRNRSRKGRKGKRVLLQISKFENNTHSSDLLTSLRTRVKKSRWQTISLPLSTAQELLDSDSKMLRLWVKCIGCGRLVQPILSEASTAVTKRRRRKPRKDSKRLRNKSTRTKSIRDSAPMLVLNLKHHSYVHKTTTS